MVHLAAISNKQPKQAWLREGLPRSCAVSASSPANQRTLAPRWPFQPCCASTHTVLLDRHPYPLQCRYSAATATSKPQNLLTPSAWCSMLSSGSSTNLHSQRQHNTTESSYTHIHTHLLGPAECSSSCCSAGYTCASIKQCSTPSSFWALGLASPNPAARRGPIILPQPPLLPLPPLPPLLPRPPLLPLPTLPLPPLIVTLLEPTARWWLLVLMLLLLLLVLAPGCCCCCCCGPAAAEMRRADAAREDSTSSLLITAATAEEALPCLERAYTCRQRQRMWFNGQAGAQLSSC